VQLTDVYHALAVHCEQEHAEYRHWARVCPLSPFMSADVYVQDIKMLPRTGQCPAG